MPGSVSQAEFDRIREGYRRFVAGDPAFLDHYEPDATIVVPETLPGGGTYGSPLEALEFWNRVPELFEDPRPEPETAIRDGDLVVVLGTFHGRGRVTGKDVSVPFVHVFRLPDASRPITEQKWAFFQLFIDTAAMTAEVA